MSAVLRALSSLLTVLALIWLSCTPARAEADAATDPLQVLSQIGQDIDAWLAQAAPTDDPDELDEQVDLDVVYDEQTVQALAAAFCQTPTPVLIEVLDEWSTRAQRLITQSKRAGTWDETPWPDSALGTEYSLIQFGAGPLLHECPTSELRLWKHWLARSPAAATALDGIVLIEAQLRILGLEFIQDPTAARLSDQIQGLLQRHQVLEAQLSPEQREQILDLRPYLDAIRAMDQLKHSPVWRVDPLHTQPKVDRNYRHCGTMMWLQMMSVMATRTLPNEVELLAARGQSEAATAYALADLLETATPGVRSGLKYDQAALLKRLHGAERIARELDEGLRGIRIQRDSHGTLAVIELFGHEFVLTSGFAPEPDGEVEWLDAPQIATRFRESTAYRELAEAAGTL